MKHNMRKLTALCLILTLIISVFGSHIAMASGTGNAGVGYTSSPRTVTFLRNDGTGGTHAVVVVTGGSSIRTTSDAEMPAIPNREGYTFVGWNTRPDGAGEWFSDTTIVIEDISVYARWAQHWYTVQFIDMDGTPISTMRVPHGGDAIAPPNPSITGWIFIGWDRPYTNVTEDITVRAVYREVIPDPPPVVPSPPPVVPSPPPVVPSPPPVVPGPPPAPPPNPPIVISPPPAAPIIIVRPPAPAPAPAPPPAEEPPVEEIPEEVPEPEEEPEIVIIEPEPVPAAPEPEQIIEEPEVPLATNPGFIFFAPWGADYWALLNLILAILGAILAPIALIKVLQRRKLLEREVEIKLNSLGRDEAYIIDEEKLYQRRRLEWFAATAVLGGIGVLIFILTQDMRKTMALMDWWTIFHIIAFVLELIAFKLIYKNKNDDEDEGNKNVKVHQS